MRSVDDEYDVIWNALERICYLTRSFHFKLHNCSDGSLAIIWWCEEFFFLRPVNVFNCFDRKGEVFLYECLAGKSITEDFIYKLEEHFK